MTWVAYAIGAFYVFAGLVAINAGRMSLFLDDALKKLTGEATASTERLRGAYAISVGLLTLAGGIALLFLSRWAAHLFVVCAIMQAAWLIWASRALPPKDAEEAMGRRGTFNALVIYSAATAFVLWLSLKGFLR
jgi:hypothetical protein